MSLCVSIYPNTNELIVAADSRKSIRIDGKSYALDDNCQKLHVCHGKMVFACGIFDVCHSIIQMFKNQDDGNVEKLRSIAKSHVTSYLKERNIPSAKNLFLCNFLVFFFDQRKGVPVVYNFHSEDGFEMREYDYYLYWCHGTRCDEANQFIKDNIYSLPLDKLIYRIYEEVAFEEIGGCVQMYRINRSGISLVDEMKIRDKREIARLEALAHWNQVTNKPTIPVLPDYIKSTYIDSTTVMSPNIIGGTITGAVLQNSGPSTYTQIDSSGISFKDASGREKLSLFVEYDDNANLQFKNNNGETATFWMSDSAFGLSLNGVPFSVSGAMSISGNLTANTITGNTISASGDLILESGYGSEIELNSISGRNVRVGGTLYVQGSVAATQSWVNSNFVKSLAGQNLSCQVYGGYLEVFQNGSYVGRVQLTA